MAFFANSLSRNICYPPRSQARQRPSVITLLTDFGLEDAYVGIMKGVIAGIHPHATVIDITHQIPPQNVALGSFQLGSAYAHFPPHTIHLAVVDPGVGGSRRAVAVQTPSGTLIGPDNGLFSHVLMQQDAIAAIELTNNHYWYSQQPSNTFHGRDIFAPTAAYLARGISLQELGSSVLPSSLKTITSATDWQRTNSRGIGTIQAIDHFGNLITNIPASQIQNYSWSLQIGQYQIPSATSYCSKESNPALKALVGSHGWLEIALPSGNAQKLLQTSLGESVQLQIHA